MRIITLARKPLSESNVASNVIKHGTGAMNINAIRIPYPNGVPESGWAKTGADGTKGYLGETNFRMRLMSSDEIMSRVSAGRWPANMILQHLPGCVPSLAQEGHQTTWECVEGCPCLDLNNQSGITRSAVAKETKVTHGQGQFVNNNLSVPGVNQHGGEGGASRFFKQVKP